MTWHYLIFSLLVVASIVTPASAQSPVVSVVSVIDGVTIEIHGQRIRLDDLILVDEIVSPCPPAARAAEYEQIPQ